MTASVRAMTDSDVEAVGTIQISAFEDLGRRLGEEIHPPTPEMLARMHLRLRHLVIHDPGGSWVACDGQRVVGCALALRRESLWGLSLLVVDPACQSAGVGRRLLETSLEYAEGCDRAIILSSTDVRAMRSYATHGFDLHPQMRANGAPDRRSLPARNPRVREGSVDDADRCNEVDRAVRGAPRGPDHVRLAEDFTCFVVDDSAGRGYAYQRPEGDIATLAATDEQTASDLLWRCLAHADDTGVPAGLRDLNAVQQWAINVCYEARMVISPGGPVFWRGGTPPPCFIPSGAYL